MISLKIPARGGKPRADVFADFVSQVSQFKALKLQHFYVVF